MAKRRRRKTRRSLQAQNEPRVVRIVEYEITPEPIQDRRYKRLPRHVKDAFERLHYEAQRHPHQVIPELLDWIEKYPNMPMLYNYLSVAYSWSGQPEKAKEVIEENYRRNPDYLFARLNYAELYLAEGDYDRVAEILEHKFDLKLLCPERKRFHVSEVAGFMGLVGIYFFETGKQELAKQYLDILEKVAPEFPVTKQLHRKLHPSFLRRMLRR